MILHGRPLRFLAIVGLSWVCARLYLVSPFAVERPAGPPPTLIAARGGRPPMSPRPPADASISTSRSEQSWYSGSPSDPVALPQLTRKAPVAKPGRDRWPTLTAWPSPPSVVSLARKASAPVTLGLAQPPLSERVARVSRLSGYAYLFARSGSGTPPLASAFGQLGGSQAGLRLDYALSDTVALTARATSPLAASRGREVALGVKWRPTRLPVDLIAERRQSLGRGGRDAFALMATGGFGPVALPARFRLEAYGQAGVVGIKSRDAFVEGQVTALRDVARAGPATLALGAGVWGGAQPDVERLDVGPRARLGFALGRQSIGLALDYRHRVAGSARPGSGATLTLDTSF